MTAVTNPGSAPQAGPEAYVNDAAPVVNAAARAGAVSQVATPGTGTLVAGLTEVPEPAVSRAAGRRGLRRLGASLTTVALVVLGLSGGLWLGSPASAATPPIKVDMGGGTDWTSTPTSALLDTSALAPGGSVTGSMAILDNSDSSAGSGATDTMRLSLVDGSVISDCDAPAGIDCGAAGRALKTALAFTVTATSSGGTSQASALSLTVADLIAGAPLASGLVNGNTIALTVVASLPNRDPGVDNAMQYGKFAFDLALSLDTATPGGNAGDNGTDDNNVVAGNVGGNNAAGALTPPEVLGENNSLPGGGPAANGTAPGGSAENVLVLGEHHDEGDLSYTGVALAPMLAIGGGVLAIGLLLIYASRRRDRAPVAAPPTAQ